MIINFRRIRMSTRFTFQFYSKHEVHCIIVWYKNFWFLYVLFRDIGLCCAWSILLKAVRILSNRDVVCHFVQCSFCLSWYIFCCFFFVTAFLASFLYHKCFHHVTKVWQQFETYIEKNEEKVNKYQLFPYAHLFFFSTNVENEQKTNKNSNNITTKT